MLCILSIQHDGTPQEAFGAGDTVKAYPSYGFTPAAAVQRMAKSAQLDEDGK
jgi:hypothetical protein